MPYSNSGPKLWISWATEECDTVVLERGLKRGVLSALWWCGSRIGCPVLLVFLLNGRDIYKSLFLGPYSAQVAATVLVGLEGHFWLKGLWGWIHLTKEFIRWNSNCQNNETGWRVGWEGVVEEHKWSKPFRAAVSLKLIPPSLILHITWAKSRRCRSFLLQTASGCGF